MCIKCGLSMIKRLHMKLNVDIDVFRSSLLFEDAGSWITMATGFDDSMSPSDIGKR